MLHTDDDGGGGSPRSVLHSKVVEYNNERDFLNYTKQNQVLNLDSRGSDAAASSTYTASKERVQPPSFAMENFQPYSNIPFVDNNQQRKSSSGREGMRKMVQRPEPISPPSANMMRMRLSNA